MPKFTSNQKMWLTFLIFFGLLWLIPLLMPVGSLERYAMEEMRVLAVGFLLGLIFVTLYRKRKGN